MIDFTVHYLVDVQYNNGRSGEIHKWCKISANSPTDALVTAFGTKIPLAMYKMRNEPDIRVAVFNSIYYVDFHLPKSCLACGADFGMKYAWVKWNVSADEVKALHGRVNTNP